MNQTQTRNKIDPTVAAAFNAEWSPVAAIKPESAQGYAQLFTARYPRIAAVSGNRLAAAVRIMCKIGARQRGDQPGLFLVQSESNSRGWYQVDLVNHTCTCPDHPGIAARGGMCKHRLAIGLHIFGPDWVTADNRAMIAHNRMLHEAHAATEKAWDAQLELANRWEFHVEHYGMNDPKTEAIREELIAATRHAEALQHFENSL